MENKPNIFLVSSECERLCQSAIKDAYKLCDELRSCRLRVSTAWNLRKTCVNALLIEDDRRLLRRIVLAELDAEAANEDLRVIMTQLSKHLNFAMTLTAKMLTIAIENNDNSIYLKARRLLDLLMSFVSHLQGQKITGVRPEIFADTLVLLGTTEAGRKYVTAKILITRLTKVL